MIAVAYSPDGRYLASAGYRDRTVHLFDATTYHRVDSLKVAAQQIAALAFGPDSRTLAAGTSDGNATVWDLETRQAATSRGQTGSVEGLAFHPAGRLLAIASDAGTLRVWNRAQPEADHVFGPGPFGRMARRAAFSPDGRYLATANFNGTITVFRTPE